MQSFESFGINVNVRLVSTAGPLINRNGFWVGYDTYLFDVFGEPEKIMRVRLTARGEVEIRYMRSWQHVSVYLKQLRPPIDWNDQKDAPRHEFVLRRWEQQSRWWLGNGKTFRFLDLPSEVREVVYGHVFGPAIEPYPTNKARKNSPSNKLAILARKPNSNILRACRMVYEEASNIVFMYTPFVVQHYGILGPLTSNTVQRSRIRQLELCLTHDMFLYLFHERTDDANKKAERYYSKFAGSIGLFKLNKLRLSFGPPSCTTGSGIFDGACQKKVVDVLLELAWPFVRGHPVKLSGFVKDFQKTTFEAACLVERKKYEAWQQQRAAAGLDEGYVRNYQEEIDEEEGGVMLNGSVNEVVVASTTTELTAASMRCRCRVRCSKGPWTAGD